MREKYLIIGALGLSTLVFGYLNATNMDAAIADSIPPRSQPKDDVYIANLSADAIGGWLDITTRLQQTVETLRIPGTVVNTKQLAHKKSAAQYLQSKLDTLHIHYGDTEKWQEYNNSGNAAEKIATQNHLQATVNCVVQEIADYQVLNNVDLASDQHEYEASYESPFIQRGNVHYDDLNTLQSQHPLSGSGAVTVDSCK
ncbi:MAG: hypothetical protein JWM56_207 [Candidatus Peribacteria bacterium]|nr:hypothetical protein [Candidatus Peribacteria bacterium]